MKYGIYFAYWTKEWFADYKKYMDKVSALGFDVLEISCAALRDVYTTKEQLIELREYAKEKGLVLTAGYGPTKAENLCSEDPEAVRRAMTFFKDLLPKLQLMDIHILGGDYIPTGPWILPLIMTSRRPGQGCQESEGIVQNSGGM